MKLTRVLLVLLVLSLIVTAPTVAGEATLLLDIEIEQTAEETRVYLKADGTIKDYRKAQLKKNAKANRPDRIYLDLKNVRLAGPIPAQQVGTALARVRTGLRSDGVRVVFDSSLDELFDYTISEQPDGLLVTIREPFADSAGSAEVMPEIVSEAPPVIVVAPAVVTIHPEPKAEGDLGLLVVAMDSSEGAREWLASSSDRKIGLQILKTVKTDQMINTSFLVTGVTPDSNGDFSVTVSFTLLDPFGKLVLNKRSFAKASGRVPAIPDFFLAEPELVIILGESDPAGEYTIIGIVQDLTSNKMVRTSHKVRLWD